MLAQDIKSMVELYGARKCHSGLMEEICKMDGYCYCVPIGIHRTNIVFYNKELFEKYEVEEHSSNTILEEFFDLASEPQEK